MVGTNLWSREEFRYCDGIDQYDPKKLKAVLKLMLATAREQKRPMMLQRGIIVRKTRDGAKYPKGVTHIITEDLKTTRKVNYGESKCMANFLKQASRAYAGEIIYFSQLDGYVHKKISNVDYTNYALFSHFIKTDELRVHYNEEFFRMDEDVIRLQPPIIRCLD